MITKGSSDKDDMGNLMFATKTRFMKWFQPYRTLALNPKCELKQVDVEEWTEVSLTVT
jgi:hypothetical protein